MWKFDPKLGHGRGDWIKYTKRQEAAARIQELCETGEILLEHRGFRFVRSGRFFFPCSYSDFYAGYVVRTTMWWSMARNRLQNIVHIYLKGECEDGESIDENEWDGSNRMAES